MASQDRSLPEFRQLLGHSKGMATQDGAGVRLTRMVGTPQLPDLDPILMLDVIRSDDPKGYVAGFPEHPHRGFETVSYMIRGSMQHLDNHGGKGLISDGGVQWMTAGRGVAHSEMPAQSDGSLFGFQLWINLPAREKMREPWYRDISQAEIPLVDLAGAGSARLIAGEWNSKTGPAPERSTEPFFADVALSPAGETEIPVTAGHSCIVYVFEGGGQVAGSSTKIVRGDLGVLSDGAKLKMTASQAGMRFLVIAGKPLREPITKYGPFVMNTPAEIRRAIEDYQAGRF